MNTFFCSSSSSACGRIWLPLFALLALGGVTAGYFLPAPTPTATTDNRTAKKADARSPSTADTTRLVQAFPLPAEDIRDTQQAPSLAIGQRGEVYVCWESKTDDATKALMLTSAPSSNGAFEQPRMVATSGIFKSGGGARGGHERRMLPRLATYGDTVALAWSDAPSDGASVRLLFAESKDGGKTFDEPTVVHSTSDARPTFISMAANANGQVAASWLDCRNGPQQVFAAVRPATNKSFIADALICAGQNDQGVCPCCPTSTLVTDDGAVLVAYRGQVDGFRDTWISRYDPNAGGKFSEPQAVTTPTWKFDGCPHDGPAMAAARGWLHVAWMDAHSGRQRTYYGRGKLAEMKFNVQELNAAGPGTQSNAKLCIDAAGRLHAVWEESLADEREPQPSTNGAAAAGHQHAPPAGSGRAIVYACSLRADGRFEQPIQLAARPGAFQGRPAIACGSDGQIVVAWTELDENGKRVVVTRLPGPAEGK